MGSEWGIFCELWLFVFSFNSILITFSVQSLSNRGKGCKEILYPKELINLDGLKVVLTELKNQKILIQ